MRKDDLGQGRLTTNWEGDVWDREGSEWVSLVESGVVDLGGENGVGN